MKKQIYDNVGIISVLLNDKLNELKACQEEKEAILGWIDQLTQRELLEQSATEIKKRLASNLERFKKVVAEIEKLKYVEL